jgi:hypothetical protein
MRQLPTAEQKDCRVTELLTLLVEILSNLGTLVLVLFGWLVHWWIAVAWFAWWLWGVDWNRVWPVLARGGWAVLVLLLVIAALAWSETAPREFPDAGPFAFSNFWWHLAAVSALVALTLFCGWLQLMFRWEPAPTALDDSEERHDDSAHALVHH